MTPFEKRVERALAALGPLPRKMTFVYADGHRVEVTGFLAAMEQSGKGEGIVDVLGASEGLKDFILAAQCDITTLWDDETAGGAANEQINDQSNPGRCQAGVPVAGARLSEKKARQPRKPLAQRKEGRRP